MKHRNQEMSKLENLFVLLHKSWECVILNPKSFDNLKKKLFKKVENKKSCFFFVSVKYLRRHGDWRIFFLYNQCLNTNAVIMWIRNWNNLFLSLLWIRQN